jgi:hypothetical protein
VSVKPVAIQYRQGQWSIGDVLTWEYEGNKFDVVLFGSHMISQKVSNSTSTV